ncbi:hypothetical protein H0O01_02450 [Candidatus Micrarchaeota archaeon]|nr:hypothetical protein [Candidatus Micrarchaeota archaeon]
MDRLLRHAKRANEIIGNGAARRWALKAVEEFLVVDRFVEAGEVAKEYGLDKDGAADEAIGRAARRMRPKVSRNPSGSLVRPTVFRMAGEQAMFRIEAQTAVYGYSKIEEESLRHLREFDMRIADERRSPPEPGSWIPRSRRMESEG